MEAKGTRLVKRENGFWYIVTTGNSRGISTRTRDLGTAETTLALYIQGKNRQEGVSPGLTVHQALDDYLDEHVEPNVATKASTKIIIGYFKAHFAIDKRVADVWEEDIDDPSGGTGYIQRRRTRQLMLKRPKPKPASDGTLRREIGVLRAAFEHAARKRDPGGKVRLKRDDIPYLPRPARPSPKDRWLTREEEDRLIAACPVEGWNRRLTRIYRFLILGLDTGARKGALATLTWFQVDFQLGRINLNPTGRAQTNKRRPVVRMSDRLHAMLERAYREKTGGLVLDHEGDMRVPFKELVLRANLEAVTPHTLRHTWATRAARAGVSMREIADWLGDNIATVEKNYYHHSPDYLKDAIDWRERER